MSENLLQIKNLSIEFRTFDGVVKAINGLNLELPKGKTLGLVGETGAGKTTTALAVMGLVPTPPGVITSGEILFDGRDLLKADKKELQYRLAVRMLEHLAEIGLLSAEELVYAKRLAGEKYTPQTVWE